MIAPFFGVSSACTLCFLPLALATGASPVLAQGDIEVLVIQPSQAIQDGTTPIVAGRPTLVRAGIRASSPLPAGTEVDAVLRVFIDGAEASFSPIFSVNGPIEPSPAPSQEDLGDSLNFNFVPPMADNVTLEVEVNPPGAGQVDETDFSNNVASLGPIDFVCRTIPEMIYVPIDLRPGGGDIPNLPDPDLIRPGQGDNFVQGAYPVADWEYHRSDAPSKLWTGNLNFTPVNLLNSLQTDFDMMSPQPDYIYAWVPGGLPYNGAANGSPGEVAMGNTEPIRYQRTLAHELGHLQGLNHTFGQGLGAVGVDVEEHLSEPLGIAQLQSANKLDMMFPGQVTSQAWVNLNSYSTYLNSPVFACEPAIAAKQNQASLLIAGTLNSRDGSFGIQHALTFSGGQSTPPVASEVADVVLRAFDGQGELLATLPLSVQSSSDACAECGAHHGGADEDGIETSDSDLQFEVSGFVAVLPSNIEGEAIARVTFSNAQDNVLGELNRSSSAPVAAFTGPDLTAPLSDLVQVTWEASDADGDVLTSTLRYSPNGTRMVPLATAIEGDSAQVDFSRLPAPNSNAYLELLVSDGLRTSSTRLSGLAQNATFLGAVGNAPWVEILTPDDGTTQPRGSSVFLHSSGWDLEDRALTGESIQWFSDLDGPIASGRVATAADLSVGDHVITVVATDSSGLSTSRSSGVTITDRVLPGEMDGIICQPDLGFGGPGIARLSFCGEALSPGSSADLRVEDAPAFTGVLLLVGLEQNPTPFAGGTIITSPILASIPGVTDATGTFELPGVGSGAGPLSVFLQAIYIDDAQVEGLGITNALEAVFLP